MAVTLAEVPVYITGHLRRYLQNETLFQRVAGNCDISRLYKM